MILDSIVHENSIKSWANGTNWITRSSLKDHITKINKKLHHERCRSHLPRDGSRTLSTIFKTCFKSTPRINLQSFDWELMKRKCLDEGLALRLASSNVELTNFYEKGALSEFGEERIERDFCKVILAIKSFKRIFSKVNLAIKSFKRIFSKVNLAIKSLLNEWNESSIYRV